MQILHMNQGNDRWSLGVGSYSGLHESSVEEKSSCHSRIHQKGFLSHSYSAGLSMTEHK